MSENDQKQIHEPEPKLGREPVFLLPGAVMAMIGVLVAIHVASQVVLNADGQLQLAVWFGFVPFRLSVPGEIPGGMLPLIWTPFTHALLHAGWEHLLINCAWLAIFGTPVAQRYGWQKFLVLFFITAAAGAFAFVAFPSPNAFLLIGASGGIAGLTGAAMRFIFQPVQIARHPETGEVIAMGRKLATYADLWRNVRTRFFIVFWVGINLLTPVLPIFTGGAEVSIAWQAHIGGFLAGLVLVPLCETGRSKQA